MGVTTTQTNKPFNPRGNDQSPLAYNRAKLFSGKALDFDGVNDTITGSSSSLPASGYTIAAWFNLDTLKASGVFTWGDEATSERRSLFVWDGGSGTYYLYSSTYGSNVRGNTPLSIGRWYFGAITLTNEGEATIYLNGNQDAIGTNTLAAYTGTTYKIGDTGSSEAFDGEISGARVFNQVLTAAQVADLYNNPEKVVPTGVDNTALKLWLPMQEGAGTTAYDGSGNGNHGTISGATYVHGIGAPVSQTAVIDWNKGVNSFTYSEEFSNAAWLAIDVTKVSTSITDYIGGTTAANITWLAGNPRYFYQNKNVSGASTVSFYVKSNGGGNKFRLFANATGVVSSDFTATNEWIRYSYNFTGNGLNGIGIIQASDNSAADLLVCFAQVETNATAGPYTPTLSTAQTSPVLLPQGLTTGRDITGVNLFENVRKQGALNLDGNSWAEVHDNASVDITSAITLEAWVYLDSAPIDNVDSMHSLMTKKSANVTDSEAAFDVRATGANGSIAITGGFDTGALQTINIATGLSIDQWYHILITYDSGSVVTYLNGAQVNTGSMLSPIIANAYDVWIGRHVNAGGLNSYAEADIAQPRIYNRALTAEEVQRNYNAGKNTYTN